VTDENQADVVIVGGGPAGSTAAFALAKRGYDVLLLDKARHPRETVGESILPSAWKYFDLLGVSEAIERDGYVKKAGGVVVWGDQITEISFRDFAYERPGLHVERDAMDFLLLDNARRTGARVREGLRAASFAQDSGGDTQVAIADEAGQQSQISCRFLVDATGQAAFVARQQGGRRLDQDFRFVSLWGYFAGSHYVSSGGMIRPFHDMPAHHPMTFVSRLADWGWVWHIPLREMTSVGINVPIDHYRRDVARHASIEDYFLETCANTKHLRDLLSAARLTNGSVRVLRDYSYLPDSVAGPGYFVVGDAAGFVDPIFSIGVVMALYSGYLAAWAIDRSLRSAAHAETSRRLFAREMRGRYELARAMALPGVEAEESGAARSYFDFFSQAEKELMWAAASMTTRSAHLVRTAGGDETWRKNKVFDVERRLDAEGKKREFIVSGARQPRDRGARQSDDYEEVQ
jgi:flavin-dependent dehydrogenase